MLTIVTIFLFILILLGAKIMMDLATVQTKLSILSTKIDQLIALPSNPAPVDLQPLGDAVDAIEAKVDAKLAAPAP